jgi:hypothetical protein
MRVNPFDDYMTRYSTPAMYTFEFSVAVAVGILTLALWARSGDARWSCVYVIGGLYDSAVELLAQGSGVRHIPDASLFGAVRVGYPALPFILGFFEGGVLLLTGYGVVRGVMDRDRSALRVSLLLAAGLFVMISIGAVRTSAQLAADPEALTVTTRALFSKGSLVILALCYAVAVGYVLGRASDPRARRGLLLWYVAVAAVGALWYTPLFVSGGRVIAELRDGGYVPVGLSEQIAVLYGYSILFEAAGFYLPVWVVLRMLRLI